MNSDHKDVWILAEQRDGRVQRISYELLTRGLDLAKKRKCRLCAMLFGHKIDKADLDSLIACGADLVAVADAPELAHFLVEPYAACMAKVINDFRPEIILGGATSAGRTLLPYVAMNVHCGLTADCTLLDIEEGTGNLLQTRPAIGGNIMATIKTPDFRPQMATVRPHSTPPAKPMKNRKGEVVAVATSGIPLGSRIVHKDFIANTEKRGIQDAEIVVAVGRGIKKPENIQLARRLADALGAALGATRDVVDRGWLGYPHQIGLSGKTISPEVYVGIGVSGSIQHLAGMQTAKTIIAVNSDPDAQIFKVADLGIVGDLFEVVPPLIDKALKGGREGFLGEKS